MPPEDELDAPHRYYRGRCVHGGWYAIVALAVPSFELTCPDGCTVTMETAEA